MLAPPRLVVEDRCAVRVVARGGAAMADGSAAARRQVRQQIAALGQRGITSRVPDEVRAAIVGYAQQRRREGARWRAVADEVGFSVGAVTGWVRGRPAAVVPVRVRAAILDAAPAAGVVVVLPSGVRVEGLQVADVPTLLAQLA